MDTPRKLLWPKIVATVVLLPVLSLPSAGPWLYFRVRFQPPDFITTIGNAAFLAPPRALMNILPERCAEKYLDYVRWWKYAAKD